MADCTVAVQCRKCRSSGMTVSEKTPQIFRPLLPAKYVTVFSGRRDALKVRCDLTDRHTGRHNNYSNPRCVCMLRVRDAKPQIFIGIISQSILAKRNLKKIVSATVQLPSSVKIKTAHSKTEARKDGL